MFNLIWTVAPEHSLKQINKKFSPRYCDCLHNFMVGNFFLLRPMQESILVKILCKFAYLKKKKKEYLEIMIFFKNNF